MKQRFSLNLVGRHNMENALAATTVANQLGVDLKTCSAALKKYEGIYRRTRYWEIKTAFGLLMILHIIL